MKKINNETLKTGAKKVVATTSLIAFLFAGMPAVVYADVNPADIVGDLQIGEDRSETKKNDTIQLQSRFGGYISLTEVEKAIKLSNLLNSYFYDGYNYTNTTPNELTTIDVNTLYSNFEIAELNGTIDTFCANNLTSKPACDGFITLSSKSVSTEIQNALINRIANSYQAEGKTISGTPVISINGDELSCILKVNGKLKKVVINGDKVPKIIKCINKMNKIYNKAIKNVSGASTKNDGSFMYNGVSVVTNESVYLSLPDDTKKDSITTSINLAKNLTNYEKFTMAIDDTRRLPLTDAERQVLRDMGYSEKAISKATKDTVSLTKVVTKNLTK